MIAINNLTAYYGKSPIIDRFSININSGDIFGVTGTNGAGKTSLLRIIAGINDDVRYNKDSIKYSIDNPRVSYVHQDFQKGLLPWFGMYKNIALPLIVKGTHSEEECIKKAKELCDEFNFKTEHQEVYKLSGGQKQKIALLRSIITNPDLLLLDEPFSAVDTLQHGAELRYNFLSYLTKNKITTLFISHDSKELTYFATKILFCYRDTSNSEDNQTMTYENVELEKRENRKTILQEDDDLDAIIETLNIYFKKYHNE
jgi:ABC-type nitrate/sulfonate/bicarbonate transport system ATPase subunit